MVGTFTLNEALVDVLRAGNLYVNIYTESLGEEFGGEIRGQIGPAP
jgi:hypothetical protein